MSEIKRIESTATLMCFHCSRVPARYRVKIDYLSTQIAICLCRECSLLSDSTLLKSTLASSQIKS